MQDIGPDMEDLLRKASQAYPLKDMDNRWDEIASKLNSAGAAQTQTKKSSGQKKYYASLLLLLLFLILGLLFFYRTGDKINSSLTVKNKKIDPYGDYGKKNGSISHAKNNQITEKKESSNNDILLEKTEYRKTKPLIARTLFLVSKRLDKASVMTSNVPGSMGEGNKITESKNQKSAVHKLEPYFKYPEFTLRDKVLLFEINTADLMSDQKKKNELYNKRFYYGISAGPEFNAVKRQGMNKGGWNIGLLGGYYFSKKFSIETGISLSQKKYSTSGESFSMKEIGPAMPPAMKIMKVDGYSKMIEIPLVFRYDLFQNNRQSFFSWSGFSSYILTKENNEYHTSMNGAEEMMYGTYKKNKRYFAASLDLGVGYARNWGKNSTIRFQPYLQIPVKGIGVGDLQILDAGLRLSVIRRAH